MFLKQHQVRRKDKKIKSLMLQMRRRPKGRRLQENQKRKQLVKLKTRASLLLRKTRTSPIKEIIKTKTSLLLKKTRTSLIKEIIKTRAEKAALKKEKANHQKRKNRPRAKKTRSHHYLADLMAPSNLT